jgi:hypothetical protein
MSINFVSTSVLESEDGLDFGKETQKDTLEINEQKLLTSSAGSSLYEQLAAHKAEKEEEYDQKGRHLRAPRAGLEEEDLEFFGDLRAKSLAAQTERENNDCRELNKFLDKTREIDKELNTHIGDRGEVRTKSLLTNFRKTFEETKKDVDKVYPLSVVGKKKKRDNVDIDVTKKKKEEKRRSFAVKELLVGYSSDSD